MGKLGREIGREVAAAFKEHRAARREACTKAPPLHHSTTPCRLIWDRPTPRRRRDGRGSRGIQHVVARGAVGGG